MKFKDFFTTKIIIYFLLVLLLLILWTPLTFLVRILAFGYLIYALICLIFAGFASAISWIKLLIALLIVIVLFFLTSKLFLLILITLMALDLYADYIKHKK